MKGSSEFEPGANRVCPQGIPIYWFNNNEAHNNGRYGLRIFTGKSGRGEGRDGFYPKSVDPCAAVSADNLFADEGATFQRQFSWRNAQNGITFGSVASLHLSDAVVADNNMRGIEGVGADGVNIGLTSESKLRGPWGANKIVRPLIIGHDLQRCPLCDHTWKPNFPEDGPKGYGRGVRLGIDLPAWSGLVVENAVRRWLRSRTHTCSFTSFSRVAAAHRPS